MEALRTYLRETRLTAADFAKTIGVNAETVERVLSGAIRPDIGLAQRMVDATGGALAIGDFLGEAVSDGGILDLRSRISAQTADLDADLLSDVLGRVLEELLGGARRSGDRHLPRLAAEAAANTYLALSTITSRQGPDRLSQALRPVFVEILEDLSAPAPAHERLDQAIELATRIYFQERSRRRRA